MKNAALKLSLGALLAFVLFGCQTMPSGSPDPNATTPDAQAFVRQVQSGVVAAQKALGSPGAQISAQPAGFLMTCTALQSYSATGADDVSAMAGKIVVGATAAFNALNGVAVTPTDISGTIDFSNPVYALAFGPVQKAVDNMARNAKGLNADVIITLKNFMLGVKAAAALYQ